MPDDATGEALRERVWERLRAWIHASYKSPPRLGLAVSGGRDSMALLALLRDFPDAPKTVLHVNHGLRPESPDEARAVAEWAGILGLPFYSRTYEATDYRELPAVGPEARARLLRYQAFDAWLEEGEALGEARVILLAHHAEDQAETMLLHFLRGSALPGLRGIEERRGRYWRPLLKERRESLEAYLAASGLPFFDDATNEDVRFRRNWLRQSLIPEVSRTFGVDLISRLGRLAVDLGEEQAVMNELLRAAWIPYLRADDRGCFEVPEAASEPLRRRLIYENGPRAELERTHYLAMSEAAGKGEFRRVDLPGGQSFVTAGGFYTWTESSENWEDARARLFLRIRDDYPQLNLFEIRALRRGELAGTGRWRLLCEERGEGPRTGTRILQMDESLMGETQWITLELLRDVGAQELGLDASWSARNLRVKLKDWGAGEAIRERLPVLILGERVLWVPGVRIDSPREGKTWLQWQDTERTNAL